MPEQPTGVKPDEQQTQQPEVPPTSDQKGAKANESVPPTDQTPQIIDDNVIEKDGEKVVPLSAHIAQREDYQAKIKDLEGKLGKQEGQPQEAEPKEPPGKQEDQPFDWDAFLQDIGAQPAQPAQSPQQPQSTSQPQSQMPQQPTQDWVNQINERIAEMRANGDEMGAYALLRQIENSYVGNMKRTARKWIKDYDNLPLQNISDDEITAFQQNPEALRGLIAKVRFGKSGKAPQSTPMSQPDNNNAPPANWEEVQEKLRQEGREDVMSKIASQSGTSYEGTRGGNAPSGEVYELDEQGKDYMRKRGIPEDKWPQFAEAYHKEFEGRY